MKATEFIKIGIVAALAGIFISSCTEENYLKYDYGTFVNVSSSGTTAISDGGETLHITDVANGCSALTAGARQYIVCDVIEQNSDKSYNVKLTGVSTAKVVEITDMATVEDESKIANDPVFVQSAWVSGGYINMIIEYEYIEVSPTEAVHEFNLYWDQNYNTPESTMFKLRHDGKGEAGPDSPYKKYFSYLYRYICFPIRDYAPEEGKTIQLEYNWYDSSDSDTVTTTISSTTYSPSKYVQEAAK